MALAAPLLIGLALLAAYIGYLLLQKTADAWLKPLLQWLFAPRQSFWKRVLLWPVREVGKGLAAVLQYVKAILGGAFFLAGAALARWLRAVAWTEDLFTLAFQRAYESLWNGLVYLREVGIPTLIEAVVKPVRIEARIAKAIADALAAQLLGVRLVLQDVLRALPWGAPADLVGAFRNFGNSYITLWRKVFTELVPAVARLTTVVIPGLVRDLDRVWDDLYRSGRDGITGIRTRLRQLEDALSGVLSNPLAWILALLGTAAGVLGLTAILAKALPWLFCRNTTNVAKRLCLLDEAALVALLAGTLTLALVLDPRALARIAQTVTVALDGVTRATVLR